MGEVDFEAEIVDFLVEFDLGSGDVEFLLEVEPLLGPVGVEVWGLGGGVFEVVVGFDELVKGTDLLDDFLRGFGGVLNVQGKLGEFFLHVV